MASAKSHPCNAFSWLYIEPEHAREAMEKKLQLRDEELAKDRHASGEPAAFKAWSTEQVQRLAAKHPNVARQIAERREHLAEQLRRRQTELLTTVATIEAAADQIEDQLAVLQQLDHQPASR